MSAPPPDSPRCWSGRGESWTAYGCIRSCWTRTFRSCPGSCRRISSNGRHAVRPLAGACLRTHLGLERPANRYATAAVPAGEETR